MAAVVRRAAAGERLIVTVDGWPVASLGPVSPDAGVTLDDLVAAGLIDPPRRPRPAPPERSVVPVDVRVARILEDIRGE